MKKFKFFVSLASIAVICFTSINAVPAPSDTSCNEGNCLATYSCPYANRDYTKYMHSQLCEDLQHHENKCKTSMTQSCCCLTLCENSCPQPE